MHGNRKPAALTVLIRKPHQLDKYKGQKQGRKKIKGAVLIAGNAEVSAWLLSRQLQVNFIAGSNLLDNLGLEYLKAAPQPDDNAAPHRIGSLLKQAERRFCRVCGGQSIKQIVEIGFRIQRQ